MILLVIYNFVYKLSLKSNILLLFFLLFVFFMVELEVVFWRI